MGRQDKLVGGSGSCDLFKGDLDVPGPQVRGGRNL